MHYLSNITIKKLKHISNKRECGDIKNTAKKRLGWYRHREINRHNNPTSESTIVLYDVVDVTSKSKTQKR